MKEFTNKELVLMQKTAKRLGMSAGRNRDRMLLKHIRKAHTMSIELLSERVELRLTKKQKKALEILSKKLTVTRKISEAEVLRMGLIDLGLKHDIEFGRSC